VDLRRRLREGLEQRRRASLYRSRLCVDSPQGPILAVDGRALLSFCGNDYLGLANHPRLVESLRRAAVRYGVGSGASHLLVGHSSAHRELEEALAEHTGRERALLFSSGYLANLGAITALVGTGDRIFQDRLNHASLLDGGRLSGARLQRFPHGDLENLERRLSGDGAGRMRLVVVDGVFSMDGDIAPLPELASLCRRRDATLMVDDAHGLGVLGESGGGSLEAAGLHESDVPILMGTLGKALGTAGAFVAGGAALIETLIQCARTYIYTTAIPPAVAAATLTSLDILRDEPWRREHLRALVARFREGAEQLALPVMPSTTAIQPLLVGEAERAVDLSDRLRGEGLLIGAIRPPTVPVGGARLRIALSAAHSEEHVDRLLDALAAHCGA